MSLQIHGLSKTFSNGKGIFDLRFEVKKGEVFGYLGPNGAGKSTTIRHLMGFMKPSSGSARIKNLDCWKESAAIQMHVGYLPGEIAFLEGMNGMQTLQLLGEMRGMKDLSLRDRLIDRFQFDVKTPIKKMSKGMKQKVGIVAAFMHDPEILILDEPTSGLDPLMQNEFIQLILEEKAKGKTILMSSHLFEEIERTCDRVGIIKDGRLVAIEEVKKLKEAQQKLFKVQVKSEEDLTRIKQSSLKVKSVNELTVKIDVQGNYDELIRTLSHCGITNIDIDNQSIEEMFMNYYDRRVH
ncbi:ABC-2 type transport system ATP-binding protein [Bacillus pakistanensis]|uniref:ABC-2 type transport system ATP-binding protein n=1 Tax=Rossellomorea pakistanensis TaxID=992288 RepID=A0ABS2N6S0_9BACI|nr:ABC transporter ATP-binding protein [Bacillus pakistanensis]MBM7583547.1 ABC-2 type transport system ATP-binding protein [Bacillus pakistanensis]